SQLRCAVLLLDRDGTRLLYRDVQSGECDHEGTHYGDCHLFSLTPSLSWDGLCVGCGRQSDFLARRREARVGVTRTARASHSQMGTRSLVAHSGSHTRARSPRKHPSCALSRWSSFALTVLLMLDKGS